MPEDITREEQDPKKFKTQPWTLFDTIASESFLLGDTDNPAIGSPDPAINGNGEMVFFASSRTKSQQGQLTNMDKSGELSFGMWVYQIYLILKMPPMLSKADNNAPDYMANMNISPVQMLCNALINWSVLSMQLGQENQMWWPTHRFGAGGGLADQTLGGMPYGISTQQNGLQRAENVLKLPEPIAMVKGDPLSAVISIHPIVRALLGTPGAPGVGAPLLPYVYSPWEGDPPAPPPMPYELPMPPFSIELGLQGKRVKRTQYGQVPGVTG